MAPSESNNMVDIDTLPATKAHSFYLWNNIKDLNSQHTKLLHTDKVPGPFCYNLFQCNRQQKHLILPPYLTYVDM